MDSSSSEPNPKAEGGSSGGDGGGGCGGSTDGCGGGGGESSEAAAANEPLLVFGGPKKAKKERGCTAKERISKMAPCAAGKRSSIYRGVTRHRWTGRYEAHLWDKSTWNQNQNKKGKQVYLGAYDEEEAAARAYDLAALKYWGPGTLINFPVTDYTRDLDEMQSISREDYLASLRRKSSGFSRGISKFRGLSSRWDSSFSRMAGSEYLNMQYGEDTISEGEYIGGLCIERKIDLTSYIKWWGGNKSRPVESAAKSLEVTKHRYSKDIGDELELLEWEVQPTEPYQMPRLGTLHEAKRVKHSKLSALSILSQSDAYKSLQDKASRKQETSIDIDDNENKSIIHRMECGKAVERSSYDVGGDQLNVALGIGGGLPLQQNVFPLAPFLSAPLLTSYNTIEPLADSILWSSLVPGLPTGLPRPTEVMKTEPSSSYTIFRQDEKP